MPQLKVLPNQKPSCLNESQIVYTWEIPTGEEPQKQPVYYYYAGRCLNCCCSLQCPSTALGLILGVDNHFRDKFVDGQKYTIKTSCRTLETSKGTATLIDP